MAKSVLDGIRVVDLTWVWAGPYCVCLLADMGAEVIKVESNKRPDLSRQYFIYYDDKPGINRAVPYSQINRNKKCCTIDPTQAAGIELIKRLVGISDIVAENYSPRVAESLGLGYRALKEVKPDIIMLSMPGFGMTGPEKDYLAYGPTLEAVSGITDLIGYPDGSPQGFGLAFTDPVASIYGVTTILATLYYRKQTGKGQHIEFSQQEGALSLLPEAVMEYTMNGRVRRRMGNHDDIMAPHGCYKCRGEDEWVTIAVSSDEEWEAFCNATGKPDWSREEKFADGYKRWKNQEELDRLISEWTEQHASLEVMHILQSAGVAAGPSYNAPGLINDPQIKERGFFSEIEHPEVGKRIQYGAPWRLSATPYKIREPAPLLGQHNDYVFSQLLGMSQGEINKLVEEKIIY